VNLNKIYYEEKDNIGYIVINDPPSNKMTRLFLEELVQLFRETIVNSKVYGIIITGKGRHYSSGADVDELKDMIRCNLEIKENEIIDYPKCYLEIRDSFNYLNNLSIPVISSINGFCIGSGFELALCSHVRIVGKGSILGLPESTFGILPGVTGTLRYTELLGIGKAMELVLSGENLSSEEAYELGLIDQIVSKKENLKYC
jgi:enoyl-CoA hydratase/carnithine racemase